MLLRTRLFFIVTCLAFFSVFISLYKGSTPATLYQLLFNDNDQFHTIFLQLRLPRTIAAFVCGGLLALAGTLMQLLLQNPLADPYVLGISGGAALVTLLLMLLGISGYWLIAGAWLGSLLTILLIFALARKHRWQTHTLLLTGIALAGGFSAGISLILLLSPDASLHSMLFWLSGDLNDARFPYVGLMILGVGLLICLMLAPGLNILSRGPNQAQVLGLPAKKFHVAIFLISSLFTATAVTLAGCIGFVGLIIPHFTRMLTGYDHRLVLPISMLLGGALLTVADTLARTVIAPEQLPVGIFMAIIGVPTFIWLLQNTSRVVSMKTSVVPRSKTPFVPRLDRGIQSTLLDPAVKPRDEGSLRVQDEGYSRVQDKRRSQTRNDALIHLNQVTITQQKTICRNLTLQINPGEIWGILSPNGGGKTTLLHTLAGLHSHTHGDIFLKHKKLHLHPIKTLAQQIGLLFQDTTDTFPQTVWEYCLASRYPHLPYFQPENAIDKQIVTQAIQTMELDALKHQSMQQLSGGEKRRAALAAILAQTPNLYLLDEPTNHLDMRHQLKTLAYFHDLAQTNRAAVIMSLHDINLAQQFCQHILMLLPDGNVMHGTAEQVLTAENLTALYQHPITSFQDGDTLLWYPTNDKSP